MYDEESRITLFTTDHLKIVAIFVPLFGGFRVFVDRNFFCVPSVNNVIERAIHWISKGVARQFIVHWTPGAELRVMGNAGKLLQVLMNLITNAYDAAQAATSVTPQLWITAQVDVHVVSLFLHDNGSGIAPDHLVHIFDPFFTTKPVGKGTGLGLSISYGIIEQHAGRLYARNHPEGGAEFVIELPLAPLE